jgi:hypothetical protein
MRTEGRGTEQARFDADEGEAMMVTILPRLCTALCTALCRVRRVQRTPKVNFRAHPCTLSAAVHSL